MPSITGLTAARMEEIEGQSVVAGNVVGDFLFLVRHNGTSFNAGNVRGPQGPAGSGGGGGGGIDGSFTPSNPAHWPVVPTTLQQALDFIAERLSLIEQHNFVVLLNDGEGVPSWVRASPETVVMYRPPA